MSKVFQIYEVDVETLERELPALHEFCLTAPGYNERKDIQEALSLLKTIASNVRWNYGPHQEVGGAAEEQVSG